MPPLVDPLFIKISFPIRRPPSSIQFEIPDQIGKHQPYDDFGNLLREFVVYNSRVIGLVSNPFTGGT